MFSSPILDVSLPENCVGATFPLAVLGEQSLIILEETTLRSLITIYLGNKLWDAYSRQYLRCAHSATTASRSANVLRSRS